MKFDKYPFSNQLKQSLKQHGFIKPTDIQYKSIPQILSGQDILAIAQTGTGKTAAFAIPIISMLEKFEYPNDNNYVKALVMVPTRELAIQIEDAFNKLNTYSGLQILAIIGGVEIDPQVQKLNNGVDILIATPGRIADLVHKSYLNLKKIKFLVLDEADHMLDKGFHADIKKLIKFLPKKRQTMFFSATINETIKDLAYDLVSKPVRIQISPKDPVSKNIEHAVIHINMDEKRFFLERIINEHPDSKIIVFVRTKVRAERVFKAMERVNITTATLHGNKNQNDRFEVLEKFKLGDINILIATDISARGIDVNQVDYVINYDLPDNAENYIHRIGRTGRGTHKGNAISFCSSEEQLMLKEIEAILSKPIRVMELKNIDYVETLAISLDNPHDWKALIKDNDLQNFKMKKKKR